MSSRTSRISTTALLALAVSLEGVVGNARAVTVTFDAFVYPRPASYTEAGITVVPADNPEDHVHLGDNDDDGSPDLMLHALCCSSPYQFTYSGGRFTPARVDFVLVGGTHTFTSSSGATITPTASGTITFPADGWQGITAFTWRDDGTFFTDQGITDNLQFCPGDCDDGNVCTTDRCEPDAAGADANGCTHAPNDEACDDGVFCDGADRCSGGACVVHAGDPCVGGPVCANTCDEKAGDCYTPAGTECEEDGDACTEDVCGTGVCVHDRVVAPSDCTLLQDALRQALSLGTQVGGLVTVAGDDGLQTNVALLSHVQDDLAAAARALGGKDPGAPGFFDSAFRRRVRLALAALRHTRPRLGTFLNTLSRPPAVMSAEATREVARRARVVDRGVKALKAELRRLRRVLATFARSRR